MKSRIWSRIQILIQRHLSYDENMLVDCCCCCFSIYFNDGPRINSYCNFVLQLQVACEAVGSFRACRCYCLPSYGSSVILNSHCISSTTTSAAAEAATVTYIVCWWYVFAIARLPRTNMFLFTYANEQRTQFRMSLLTNANSIEKYTKKMK